MLRGLLKPICPSWTLAESSSCLCDPCSSRSADRGIQMGRVSGRHFPGNCHHCGIRNTHAVGVDAPPSGKADSHGAPESAWRRLRLRASRAKTSPFSPRSPRSQTPFGNALVPATLLPASASTHAPRPTIETKFRRCQIRSHSSAQTSGTRRQPLRKMLGIAARTAMLADNV